MMSPTGDRESEVAPSAAEHPMVEVPAEVKPEMTEKPAEEKKPKEKKPKAKKPQSTKAPSHPPYFQMIKEALVALNEKSGSSPYAIAKHMEEKHKGELPVNFRKTLTLQLRNSAAKGKLIKIKASYKLSESTKKEKKAAQISKKPKETKAKSAPKKKSETITKAAKKPVGKKMKSAASQAKPKQLKSIKSPAAKKAKKA